MTKFAPILAVLCLVSSSLAFPNNGPRLVVPTPRTAQDEEPVAHPILGADMKLNEQQKKSGIPDDRNRWWGGIYFQISTAFTQNEYDIIYSALGDLVGATCLPVYEWPQGTNPSGDYVYINKGGDNSGCWSWVGKQGGRQELNLQHNGCIYRDIALHEAIHAYGFFHEQSRVDRDNYVNIHWQNIPGDVAYNFDISQGSNHYNVPYDYWSIMHYDTRAFSNNGQPTITTKGGGDVGSRGQLTGEDRAKLWAMYC